MAVWLPLAIANLTRAVMQLTSCWVPKDAGFKVPTLGDVLGWCGLQAMSEAVSAEEREQNARDEFEKFRSLAARLEKCGAKVEMTTSKV